MLILNPNGDGAAFARRSAVLDALRRARQAPPSMADVAPTLERLKRAVAADYRIVGELGRGGMGVVYLAYESALERPVALKVLAPSLANDPTARARFLREARTAARVGHPNIVPIHAVGEAGEFVFFTMEYVEGDTVGELVRAGGPMPVGVATWILHDVGRAVGYAHARGVIHRDLTPENVMIERPGGRALVMDFGIARVEAQPDDVREGYVLGAAPFMSPERVTGESGGDERSDVYALGVTGYFAVTGRVPFEGETAAEIFRQHLWSPAPTLHLHGEDLDLTFAHAVGRCLDKNPDRRFQDGDDLADALAQAPEIRGRELPVPLEAFVERLRRYSARTRGLSLPVGAAVIALADGVARGAWTIAASSAGFLVLAAAGAGLALLPTMRRVLRAGFTRADVVHALSVELGRDRQLRRFRHGSVSARPARVARWIAYGGVGVVGLGAASSLVPLLPPEVGLVAIGYGVVVALGASVVGVLYARRRLNRPGALWLRFWNSRAGEWAARLAAAGLPRELTGGRLRPITSTSLASDELNVDESAARRISEWVEGKE